MSKLVPPMSTATKSPTPAAVRGERRAHDAAGRARREQRDRAAGDVVGRHHAAGRLHDQQRPAVAGARAACPARLAGVVRDARRDVRVHERGRHPLELRARAASPRARARCARRRGTPRARSRACARSCAGFTNENRYITAIDAHAERLQPLHAARARRPRRAASSDLALEVACARGSGCAPGGARSGSGPGSSGPRSPPCGSGAARSRRGGPR